MNEYTPIIKQYLDIKSQHSDKILLFRVGDFYELFFDDAVEVSNLLLLTLTCKSGDKKIPMAGFPVRYSNVYITKLMKLNKKLAICDQVSESKKNGLMDRKVVKILTPGTYFNDDDNYNSLNSYIVCIYYDGDYYGLAALDINVGYFFITKFCNKIDLINELDKIRPNEIIVPENFQLLKSISKNFFVSVFSEIKFNYDFSFNLLFKFFNNKFNDIKNINFNFFRPAIIAAGCLLDFLLCTQNSKLDNITSLETNLITNHLYIDSYSRKNLEIFSSMTGSEKDSLFFILDKTITNMGKRLLHRWLNYPILSRNILNDRFVSVSILKKNQSYLKIKPYLSKICDLEKILSKITFSLIKPLDLNRLKTSLEVLPFIKNELSSLKLEGLLEVIYHNMGIFEDLVALLNKSIVETPLSNLSEGGFIKSGFNKKLDEYKFLANNVRECLIEYQNNERIRLGIPSLVVAYSSKKDEYFIEILNSDLIKITNDYRKINSNSKISRYTSIDLINIEKKVSFAKKRFMERELKIFNILIYKIRKNILLLKSTTNYLAILDVLNSFAIHSSLYDWCTPVLSDDSILDIKSSRHPVVEYKNKSVFVPNDLYLDLKLKGLIITGANMGGKSTYMRQIAIIIILAHIGAHVPACSAIIGKIDKVFTRIGASDDLANSYSTFMLEMKEVSNILFNATPNSFVLIDEIGRGTGYFDGKALAFSIIKYLIKKNKSFFLFSTHFHDLHIICDSYSCVSKMYFQSEIIDNDIINFFYKIEAGYSDNSFGIEVANLAGLPKDLIECAKSMRDFFRSNINSDLGDLKNNKSKEIFSLLEQLDPDSLSPKDALNYLYLLKDIFDKK